MPPRVARVPDRGTLSPQPEAPPRHYLCFRASFAPPLPTGEAFPHVQMVAPLRHLLANRQYGGLVCREKPSDYWLKHTNNMRAASAARCSGSRRIAPQTGWRSAASRRCRCRDRQRQPMASPRMQQSACVPFVPGWPPMKDAASLRVADPCCDACRRSGLAAMANTCPRSGRRKRCRPAPTPEVVCTSP